eukprot:2059564-Rhodomonas_salina.1
MAGTSGTRQPPGYLEAGVGNTRVPGYALRCLILDNRTPSRCDRQVGRYFPGGSLVQLYGIPRGRIGPRRCVARIPGEAFCDWQRRQGYPGTPGTRGIPTTRAQGSHVPGITNNTGYPGYQWKILASTRAGPSSLQSLSKLASVGPRQEQSLSLPKLLPMLGVSVSLVCYAGRRKTGTLF